jgi:cobaltochelatase CobS subunit
MTSATTADERMLDRLACALALPTTAEQRATLRTLAYEALRALTTDAEVARIFASSPLVGPTKKQVNPRPCIAGLRDMLRLEALACLVHAWANASSEGRAELERIFQAIQHPTSHGTRGAGRTGFAFGKVATHDAAYTALRKALAGRHAAMPAPRRAAASPGSGRGWARGAAPASSPPRPTIDLAAMSAPELCAAIDAAAIRAGADREDILAVLASAKDERARAVVAEAAGAIRRRSHHPKDLAALPARTPLGQRVEEALVELMSRRAVRSTPGAPAPAAPAALVLHPAPVARLGETEARVIDLVLTSAGIPGINALLDRYHEAMVALSATTADLAGLRARLEREEAIASPIDLADAKGAVGTAKACDVFGLDGPATKAMFGFDVPVFRWEVRHPHVPAVDPDYIFRPVELFRLLMALVDNQRAYLHGHTGSGKTTLVEQVAARLNWPFLRLNFDSEITRLDLIGRDTLINEGGATVSRFVDGILPQGLSGPYILCFDELDFVRPDVAYVMQRALEGDGLVLTEDGGRIVRPHPMCRIVATGNTVGQGDEHGMYQGARPQSLALLDRFTVWAHVDYMAPADRETLIEKRVPELSTDLRTALCKFVEEHVTAFKAAKVFQPMSPRAMLALAKAIVFWASRMPGSRREAVHHAVAQVVLDRATQQDRAVLKAIADRVFG